MRVVVYAEGAWELKGAAGAAPMPGQPFPEAALGPAHRLVRRVLQAREGFDGQPILFEGPLRHRGRVARGSDLLDPRTLCALLSWPLAARSPDLAVVLVDADGDRQRLPRLQQRVGELLSSPKVGVPVQEFEAWLLADHETVGEVLGFAISAPPAVEAMSPGDAKLRFRQLAAESALDERAIRCALADQLDLDRLSGRCRSFEVFRRELR